MAPQHPRYIAHRGERATHPENTRAGLLAALTAGADGVEFDIQFTADGHPVVLHDRDLWRSGGRRVFVDRLDRADVAAGLPAHEPARFGDRFAGEYVPDLDDLAAELAGHFHEDTRVFAEIKTDTIPPGTVNHRVTRVLDACAPLGDRLVVISFDAGVLRAARGHGAPAIGWVVTPASRRQREHAAVLQPGYLFTDRANVTAGAASLWAGPWHWIVYEVNAASEAEALGRAGVWGVETASVAALRGGQ